MTYKTSARKRETHRLYWAKYLEDPGNRARHLVRNEAARKARRIASAEAMAVLKSGPCMDCGGKFPAVCMDFDHVRGVKVGNVSTLIADRGLSAALIEVAKCELVCSNCHRIRTRDRRQNAVLAQRPSLRINLLGDARA